MSKQFGNQAGHLPPSPALLSSEEHIEILPPVEHADKLLFQAFCNGMPIAYARLRRLRSEEEYANPVVQLVAAVRYPTWNLQSIQVAQNFRNRGIGTALLGEILHYCRYNNIQRLVGEAKGDIPALRRWYARNGFELASDNRLERVIA